MPRFSPVILTIIWSLLWPASLEAGIFPKDLNFPSTAVVHKQFNFHVIAPGVWRSSATNKRALKRMKTRGLKSVINLRRNKSYHKKEHELTRELGIRYYHFPMNPKNRPDPDTLRDILAIMHHPDNQPVLIHCHYGKDRTGLLAGLYKMQHTGSTFDAVYEEMLLYGYNAKKYPQLGEALKAWSEVESQWEKQAVAREANLPVSHPDPVRVYSSLLKPFGFGRY